MSAKTKVLGRGLGAIFEVDSNVTPRQKTTSSMEQIEIKKIVPNPKQPREHFDEDALGELAGSIKMLGVIQPVTLKKENEDRYIIISGERRLRASKIAGLTTIPAYVVEADDQAMHEMALVENIQRQDLNPIEVAVSLQRLVEEYDLTQDMLSERVGKKRSTIANYMRLLKLPDEIQSAVRDDYISMGHAKAIAGADEKHKITLLKKTINSGLSVRQVEELVKKLNEPEIAKAKESKQSHPDYYATLAGELERVFAKKITVKRDKKGGGSVVIVFDSDSEGKALLKRLKNIN